MNNGALLYATYEQYVQAKDLYGYQDTEELIPLTTTYTYVSNGNVLAMTTPDGVCTTYTYDDANQKLSVTTELLDGKGKKSSAVQTYSYDSMGNMTKTVDANGNKTTYQYDKRDQVILITDAAHGKTAFEYDRSGRLITKVLPENYQAFSLILVI